MAELTEDEFRMLSLISTFTFKDLQTCSNIEKHLKLNKKTITDLQLFLKKFVISGNRISRKKPKGAKKTTKEERELRKKELKEAYYGKIEEKP